MSSHAVLTADRHADLRVRTDRAPELGDDVMMAFAVPTEFRRLQAHYPILFRLDQERDQFNAFALFGFENGENLFLEDGRWEAGYRPLSIDIQPFLIGGAPGGEGEKQVHVDMASPRLSATGEGMRVFDADGRPTPYLEQVSDQLGQLDAGYREAREFLAALERHELLEPLTLEITLKDGSTNRLVGFHAIAEERLQALDGEALGALHRDDHLMPIFMAVASLGRFSELIARKNRRIGHG